MKLYSLLKDIKCRVLGNQNLNINGLYQMDTEVRENGLFFCLRGIRVDGSKFIESAVKNGAVAIVSEQEIDGLSNVTQIIVKNARETMSLIACKFYGNPADKLKIIGVTGTNGKTTITTLLSNMLSNFNKKSAVIGTNGIFIGNEKYDSNLTTPDPINLQKFLQLMVRKNVEYVCMEASAHAIELCKIDGIRFRQIIFTNLTADHLDYFKTMDRYFLAKSKLFSKKYSNLAIINVDDLYGKMLCDSIKINYLTYAINSKISDFTATDISFNFEGQEFKVNDEKAKIKLLGKFNVYNILAVVASLNDLGFNDCQIIEHLKNIKPIEGRFNTFNIDDKIIVIDYAHTPDGLSNILSSCREIANGGKLISVFGCGGDRDNSKRKIMGEISSKLADFTFLTTDNPRFEDKHKIISDIKNGMINNNYKIVLDRSKAIFEAINYAKAGDVIVIAGKGAEKFIDENGVKIPYSDMLEIEKYRR